MLIARLIADPDGLETRLDAVTAALEREGMHVALAQMTDFCGDVLQIALPAGDAGVVRRLIDEHFAPADVLVSQVNFRIPQLFVSDMDSTMIGQECIDELADFAGLKDQVSAITERAMQGELDFASALVERVGLLAGMPEATIDTCLADRIRPMAGAQQLVATLRAKGCRTVLVTGGFHHFADPIAAQLGFDHVVGNRLAVTDCRLTGELAGPIVDSSVKERVLRDESAKIGEGAVSLSAGDGANDIPMLRAATWGIAYRAKPKARAAADGAINRGDLTAILDLLGIPRDEWVAPSHG
ncbi:MAG: phosphoserine phosphatase SerB [Tsuneonella suprasediminis]|uniref:Phosphoserine phosphatase n=1 Tax=Tsuneonella suprasediminis TaxID=2306996 RepID=A0A419R082_9SPHN|nr:phosphoserine phosphatase SerB [Tsuneonella suprasediminis]RJX66889.1 phosphoserine phosphatase SerB [Tsuneonella suprasediminis]UBS32293.1 phosphoserine phosphatase SerB [Altererythrobacter sp. N1]